MAEEREQIIIAKIYPGQEWVTKEQLLARLKENCMWVSSRADIPIFFEYAFDNGQDEVLPEEYDVVVYVHVHGVDQKPEALTHEELIETSTL